MAGKAVAMAGDGAEQKCSALRAKRRAYAFDGQFCDNFVFQTKKRAARENIRFQVLIRSY